MKSILASAASVPDCCHIREFVLLKTVSWHVASVLGCLQCLICRVHEFGGWLLSMASVKLAVCITKPSLSLAN